MDFKVYLSHRRLERALRRWMVQRKRKAVAFSQVINAVRQEPRAGLKLSGHSYRLHCNGVLCPDLLSFSFRWQAFLHPTLGYKTPLYLETHTNTN